MTPALRAMPLMFLFLSACADMDLRSGILGRSAPDPAPASVAVATPQSIAVAQATAAELAGRIGEDLGGGVRVLSARAEGPQVFVDFQLPVAGADIPEAERAQMGPSFAGILKEQFCADESGRAFFDLGNTLNFRFQGTDGVPLAAPVLSSCA